MNEPGEKPAPGSKSSTVSAVRDAVIGSAANLVAGAALTVDAFAQLAGLSVLYELQAAEVALQRSRRDDVKQFAQRMLVDFKDLGGKLGSFLGGMNRPNSPPEQLDKLHQVLIDDLHGVPDEDFDHRYIAQQRAAHSTAITLFTSYRDHGSDEGLRNLAKLGLPVLQDHMEMVHQLEHQG